MQLVLASGDREVADALGGALADDRVEALDLAQLTEPVAFSCVSERAPDAVISVPDWARTDEDELRGTWWLARAAHLAGAPLLLVSTAAVFATADRSPKSEFDLPRPEESRGRLAHAAEQLSGRTTHRLVIVRTGPLDVGTSSLRRLLEAPEGLVDGGKLSTSPAAVADIGPTLRHLATARRYGVWHLAAESLSLRSCAERLRLPEPRAGTGPVPVPLDTQLLRLSGHPPIAPWPRAASGAR